MGGHEGEGRGAVKKKAEGDGDSEGGIEGREVGYGGRENV